jgi:hypothetical protein
MSPPYQLLSADARKEIVRRKVFYLQKAQECDEVLRTIDALPTFFDAHPLPPGQDAETVSGIPRPEVILSDAGVPDGGAPLPAPQHRRKEDLYDEEMLRLLAKVKVASKAAVFRHLHDALRGNTSIGAVESYLTRAVLRGVIVRLRRGEYTLPPQTD